MANKKYIERLQTVIFQLHGCDTKHVESVAVHEVFQGKTVWQGNVEVFDLIRHPLAKRCYGWTCGEPEEFITTLEFPPVTDAQSAVKFAASYKVETSFRLRSKRDK